MLKYRFSVSFAAVLQGNKNRAVVVTVWSFFPFPSSSDVAALRLIYEIMLEIFLAL
jgi:hypothetical protein